MKIELKFIYSEIGIYVQQSATQQNKQSLLRSYEFLTTKYENNLEKIKKFTNTFFPVCLALKKTITFRRFGAPCFKVERGAATNPSGRIYDFNSG